MNNKWFLLTIAGIAFATVWKAAALGPMPSNNREVKPWFDKRVATTQFANELWILSERAEGAVLVSFSILNLS
jgi:hypothetical protein